MHKFTKILIFFQIILSISLSCKNGSEKDLSLTTEEYKKLGISDPGKKWNINDYINSNITLSTLKMNYPYSLPRKFSKKSGSLFNRIVNTENLSFINDTTIPIDARAYTIQHFTRFYSELQHIYSIEKDGQKYYREELADINIFGLTVYDKMIELALRIQNSDDESAQNLKFGMSTVKQNYIRFISGLLNEQTRKADYHSDDLNRLSDMISASILRNNEWFTNSDRDSIVLRINAIKEKIPSGHIKENFNKTLKNLYNY